MEFGEVLSKAWKIIWNHKVLWIFGILAGCTGATGSGFSNSGYRFSSNNPNLQPGYPYNYNPNINLSSGEIALIVGLVILAILVVIVIFTVLGTIGRVGLIRGTQMVDGGAEHLLFSDLWNESMRYFWRVLGLNLLIALALFVIFGVLIFAGVLLSVVTLGLALLCLLPLLCLLVPIGWFIQVIVELANNALVIEDLNITEALRRGWEVTKQNLGPIIIMGLILIIGVNLIGGLIIGLPLAIIALPAVGIAAIGTNQAVTSGVIIGLLCFVAYLPVLIVLGGILRSYISAAWTLTYLRLTGAQTPLPEVKPVELTGQ